MPKDLENEAKDAAILAIHTVEVKNDTEMAEYIRDRFDKFHGKRWHCIVSCHFFGYSGWPSPQKYIDFKLDDKYITLFHTP